MAKELPYFKFEPNQWESGNIQMCTLEQKGLFIEICSLYWSRLGSLPVKLVMRKICNGNATAFNSLIEETIFIVKDEFICIDFLDEQLLEFDILSKTNSENARKGWEKRKKNATAKRVQSGRNAIREEKRREEKRRVDKKREEKIKLNNILLSELKNSDIPERDLEYFEIAKAFKELFIKNLKEKGSPFKVQENAKYKNYVNPIRLMMENDDVTKEQITKVFKYLQSPQGDFWKSNILSTSKLREKFQQLILQSQKNTNNGQQQNNASQGGASDEFRRKTAERLGIVFPD